MTWDETQHWHALPSGEIVSLLASNDHDGLSSADAAVRLAQLGPNTITGRKGPGVLLRLLSQFTNPLVYVLIIAGVITATLPGHLVDASVIFSVVVLNAIVGFIQESRAKAAIEALSQLVSMEATTIRDGQSQQIDSTRLVPGDLVLLQSGDRVPADLRLLRLRDLHIDESMLTGESLPVAKEHGVLPAETVLPDRKNMAYSGTLVTFGQGAGLVVATGDRTELGHISGLIESTTELATPLTRRLAHFSALLSWIIVGLAILTFIIGLLRGEAANDMFIAAVALAVAAIPEGLPAAVTIILAIGVTRMAKRNAIIRKLPAVETLGSTTVICSDKTGTLTKNEMTVSTLTVNGTRYQLTGSGYNPEGQVLRDGTPVTRVEAVGLRECLRAGVLCNGSRLVKRDGQWRVEGDPTEGALLTAASKGGIDPERLRDEAEEIDTIPFESERQYMATLHNLPEGGRCIYVKGAIEKVLTLCNMACRADGTVAQIDHMAIRQHADDLAAEGLRVLAFARKTADEHQQVLHPDELDTDMVFLGFQGMIDPPRPEAITAVHACQGAGITVKMITGDHALTARTIAREIGIVATEDATVLTGAQLAAIPREALPEHAVHTQIFARVAPEQKLRLVEALQSRGAVVAMTGDGVNDAPSLKQANIGVAMGITGTEAAKDAADMVLTDDNFASIEAAVEEGRGVYDNLRKFIIWTLPTNGGEGLLVLAAIALGIAIPVLPVHLLWINLTTAIALGMTLAFEPKEQGLMQRSARNPREPLLPRFLIIRTAYVIALMAIGAYLLFAWERAHGYDLHAARTTVATVVIMVETVYLFNCRSLTHPVSTVGFFSNRWAVLGALVMIGLQLLFVYAPFMQHIFQTTAIPLVVWFDIIVVAVSIYCIVEFEKWLRRRTHRSVTHTG